MIAAYLVAILLAWALCCTQAGALFDEWHEAK